MQVGTRYAGIGNITTGGINECYIVSYFGKEKQEEGKRRAEIECFTLAFVLVCCRGVELSAGHPCQDWYQSAMELLEAARRGNIYRDLQYHILRIVSAST